MGAAKKLVDAARLRGLVPLHSLTPDHLQELARKSPIEDLPAGAEVFATGDRDGKAVYLLSGEVELSAPGEGVQRLRAGTEPTRYPLAHHQPRRLTARALGPVSVLRIDANLLDMMLEWRRTDSYEVAELGAADDAGEEDWLVRFLGSGGFDRIPAGDLQALLARLEEIEVPPGAAVMNAGDPPDGYYIVKRGRCEVLRCPAAGEPPRVVAELGPGETFGEEALITGAPRNATVVMPEGGAVLRLPRADYRALVADALLQPVGYERARTAAAGRRAPRRARSG